LEINHAHQFLIKKLVLNDSQNVRDIEQYLGVNSKHANDLHGTQTFLSATLITETTGNSFSFTTKIEEIYEDNFNHLFERGAHYSAAKYIFEIMTASLEPISITDIEKILRHIKVKMHVNDALARMKSIVSTNDDTLSYIHQSFYDWITSNRSGVYQVNQQHGHNLIADLMFSRSPRPLIDLAIHVALAENTTLRKRFKKIDFRNAEYETYHLHSLVKKHHSPEALSLLQTLFLDVHVLDSHYETVAFIAAALGHVDQLKFLQTKGDVLSFKKVANASTLEVNEHILYSLKYYECKTCYKLLPGFNLLHVAVFNGRFEMVKYLLENLNQAAIDSKSGTGLKPIELSCLLCYLDIYKLLKQYHANDSRCEFWSTYGNCINMLKYFREEHITFDCISKKSRIRRC